MALVVVMGTAAVAAVMAAHVMMLSETVAREAAVAVVRSDLRYQAEGAAERVFWLYTVDRRLFADRLLGVDNPEREGRLEEAFMLDGRPHAVAGSDCTVRLVDALHGVSFTGPQPAQELQQLADDDPLDTERQQAVKIFLDIVADYVDADDLTHLHGMERQDYAGAGWPGLPRDAPLQCREEVYWLPGWRDVLYGPVQIIPPPGLAAPGGAAALANPSFFSSSPGVLQRRGRLDADQLAQVLVARQRWQDEGIPLAESLPADLLATVRNRFSLNESAVVTLEVQAVSDSGVQRRYSVTRLADLRLPTAYSDSTRQAWALWHRQLD